jgi:hypothetical protein
VRVEFLDTDSPSWAVALGDIPHDFYHLPAYVRIEADSVGGEARALLVEHGGSRLFLPLILRAIPSSDRVDAVSPYGYPGPLLRSASTGFESEAWTAGLDALRDAGVVSAFVRFHPVLSAVPPVGIGTAVLHGHTVSIDLEGSEETLWQALRQNHRRDVRSAAKSGLVARHLAVEDGYGAFRDLYAATMQRREAAEFYYFSDEYFEQLPAALGGRLHLVVVESGEALAAAGLFVETGGIVQYHLGGTDQAFLHARPSKLMIHFASVWAMRRGNRLLHLGGGVGGAEDSLFLFKAGFSRQRHPYYTLRVVVDEPAYRHLSEALSPGAGRDDPATPFFPAYRSDQPGK